MGVVSGLIVLKKYLFMHAGRGSSIPPNRYILKDNNTCKYTWIFYNILVFILLVFAHNFDYKNIVTEIQNTCHFLSSSSLNHSTCIFFYLSKARESPRCKKILFIKEEPKTGRKKRTWTIVLRFTFEIGGFLINEMVSSSSFDPKKKKKKKPIYYIVLKL